MVEDESFNLLLMDLSGAPREQRTDDAFEAIIDKLPEDPQQAADIILGALDSPDIEVRDGAELLVKFIRDRSKIGSDWHEDVVHYLEDEEDVEEVEEYSLE